MSPEVGNHACAPQSYIEDHVPDNHGGLEGAETPQLSGDNPENEALVERRQRLTERAQEQLDKILTAGQHPYLREHQLPGYINALRLIANTDPHSNERHAARIIGPTGSGKSATIIALAQDLEASTLLVTSRHTLVDQLQKESFPKFAPELAVQERSGRSFQNGAAPETSANVDLTNYQFLASGRKDRLPQPGEHDIIILDEGHRTLGFVTRHRLDPLETGAFIAIATTATEAYSSERTIADCYPIELDKQTMTDGIREGYLSGIQVFCSTTGVRIDNARSRKFVDYSLSEIAPLRENEDRNQQILDCIRHGLAHGNAPVMVECIRGEGQAHAKLIAELTREIDHPHHDRKIIVEAIGTHRKDSQTQIERFKAGEIDVLVTVDMGTEGSDFPGLGAIVCAAPHKSLLALEQFMGRGMRAKEHPLLCYQLVDTPLYDPDKLALCWDILGIKEPVQGLVILAERYTKDPEDPSLATTPVQKREPRIVSPDSLPPSVRSFPDIERQPLEDTGEDIGRTALRRAISAEQIPVATDGTKIALSKLEAQTNIGAESLMRVLFANAYAMDIEQTEDGEIEPHYPKEAAILLDYLVAKPEDVKFPDAAAQLGVDHQKLAYQLDVHGITPPRLYPRQEQHVPLMRHLKPWQMARMAEIIGLPRPIRDNEISLREASELSGCIAFGQVKYFEDRGILSQKVLIAHEKGNRHMRLYDRQKMLSYVDAYVNAAALPDKSEYKRVAHLVSGEDDVELRDVFAAASSLDIIATFYRTGSKRREEFFTNKEYDAVANALPEIVAARQAEAAFSTEKAAITSAPDTAAPQPETASLNTAPVQTLRVRVADIPDSIPIPVSEGILRHIIHGLGITTENDSLTSKQASQVRAKIIAQYSQEATAPESQSERSRPVPSAQDRRTAPAPTLRPQPPRPSQHQQYPNYVSRDTPVLNGRKLSGLAANRHPNILLAAAQYHPFFRGEARMAVDDKGSVTINLAAYNRLFMLLANKAIPAIPPTWIPAPAIARRHDIDLGSLNEWLAQGGYQETHLLAIDYNREKLHFCSPQLARAIVDNYKGHQHDLLIMNPSTETTETE